MKIVLRTYDLKLKHTFTISRKSIDVQPNIIVELQSNGYSGYGEATSNPYYHCTVESMQNNLKQLIPFISSITDETPDEFWDKASKLLKHDFFALCALDEAYHDLYARKKGKKLYELWGFNPLHSVKTDYTIGIDSIEKMIYKMQETPWPIYKIKLGTKEDIKIVSELRKHSDAIFRIDANCGWGVEETLSNAIELKKMGVEFLEQPMIADDWEAHKKVYQNSVLPIIADESCITENDVMLCKGHFHGVNIKLMKCGGLTPALRMITNAKKLGLKTMVGCMTESTVGISAIAHLLPELDYVDMDGPLLLAEDIATGVTIKEGIITYSNLNGTGVALIK